MAFVCSYPMPVADHFITLGTRVSEQNDSARKTSAYTKRTTETNRPRDLQVPGEVCETCYAYCANKAELWKHVRDKHGADRRLVCPMSGCGRQFLARAMSAAHMAHHRYAVQFPNASDDRPLTCELCGLLLRNLSTFRKHMAKMHPDAAAAMCGVCYLYTGDVPSLVDHVRRRHGVATETRAATTETPDTVIETPDTVIETPDTVIETPDTVIETPDTTIETPDIAIETPDIAIETPDIAIETLAATAENLTTVSTAAFNAKKRGKQIRRAAIRCDVCGKQYGNYRNMYEHRVVHGAVEVDPRSPFAVRSSPKQQHARSCFQACSVPTPDPDSDM
ncbi:Zinc finger C2H2-type,Zinc finger, RING/FYVE/PHD-type [Cinara cedri]|uniref:Zinc finger C2H2-type,Zinc finger, RING/FYVE/PHD-type n=1 Tax=Cinara cedri TaxID=506608 RepID=A0A5E4NFH1_9HEMI|nr:Zinc finger C2H2-type,Zinc finger, RING/FYVE/PHD-type [Cinara cedri]